MSNITSHIPSLADAELRRRVVAFLASRHLAALRQIEVAAEGGTVTLRGKVRTFYEKQVTQQCSQRVAGIVRLIDEVRVSEAARTPSESAVIFPAWVVRGHSIASAV